jgi:hypothetical protein
MNICLSWGHFPPFALTMFGRHIRQLSDETWFVFDSLHIGPESLPEKSLDVSLKLPPSLIRYLLVHIKCLLLNLTKANALASFSAAEIPFRD